jgi:hypothetical protein
MAEVRSTAGSATAAGFVLGRKLDSIPFSAYHILIIAVLALVGFSTRRATKRSGIGLFVHQGGSQVVRWLAAVVAIWRRFGAAAWLLSELVRRTQNARNAMPSEPTEEASETG